MTGTQQPDLHQRASSFDTKRINRDAGFIAVSSAANAALGAGFWAVAARYFPPEELGVMTAVLAVIVSAGLMVAAGVGDAYTALLPAVGCARPGVYRRGQRIWFGLALAAGIGGAVVTVRYLTDIGGSMSVAILVAVGILVWSAFLLQNYTLMSIGRARWLPVTNFSAGLGKIGLLLALALILGRHSVELAFIITAAVVVLTLQPVIIRLIDSGKDMPTTASIPEGQAGAVFNRLVKRTVISAALTLGVLNLTPFLVTVFAGPEQGALFAMSLAIVQTLDFVIGALTVSLLVHASGAPDDAAKMARKVLIKALAVAAVGAAILIPLAPLALRLLNSEYGALGGTGVTALLCAGCMCRTTYLVWAALQRARRNMRIILALDFAAAAVLLAVIPVFCDIRGALGGAFALFLADSIRTAGALTHFVVKHRRKPSCSDPVSQGPVA